MPRNLFEIVKAFPLPDSPVRISAYGDGHIHDTYLVETTHHDPDYILQKINHTIFKDVEGMMNNIVLVTGHLGAKSKLSHDRKYAQLRLIPTREGRSYLRDDQGDCWRVFIFMPGTVTFQLMPGPGVALEAGKAIAEFQMMLDDLEAPLVETLPGFHDINLRLDQYDASLKQNFMNRSSLASEERNFVEARVEIMRAYLDALHRKARLRVTHNDTKLNNILFDREGKALCLIDLDTVMPGFVHFDYGDALRTMSNSAPEDEKDLSAVRFDPAVYDAFTKGYLELARNFLSPDEMSLLPYAPVYLTFIIGLRFLTDYFNGDVYYRIKYPEHNIDRARVQFRLVAEMEKYSRFKSGFYAA